MNKTIHLYCTLRNEAQILPYFFRHYDQFVSEYFMFDDNSDDGSREIIESHSNTHCIAPDISGLDDASFAHLFSTEYRTRSRDRADWVVCVDADEFVYSPLFMDNLLKLEAEGYKIINCHGYQMISRQFPKTNGQIYEEVTNGFFDARYSKPILFKPEIDINFAPGRHGATHKAKIATKSSFMNLHFRFLDEEYVKQKHAKNTSRMSQNNIKCGFGAHNRPDFTGEYTVKWYKMAVQTAKKIDL